MVEGGRFLLLDPSTLLAALEAFAACAAVGLEALLAFDLPLAPLDFDVFLADLLGPVAAVVPVPAPPPTVTTVGAAACTGLALTASALFRPIRTPTPIASNSVPTPATMVVPEEARGARGAGGGALAPEPASSDGGGAPAVPPGGSEKRGLPRRSPQATQYR